MTLRFTPDFLDRPWSRERYKLLFDVLEVARANDLGSFGDEEFVYRSNPETEEYFGPLRIYPETVRRQAGTLDGQLHYFFHKLLDSKTPRLRIGLRVDNPEPVECEPDVRPELSWEVFRTVWDGAAASMAWQKLEEAGFELVGREADGTVSHFRRHRPAARWLERADEPGASFEIVRTVDANDLREWAPAESVPLVGLAGRLHPMMEAFLLETVDADLNLFLNRRNWARKTV